LDIGTYAIDKGIEEATEIRSFRTSSRLLLMRSLVRLSGGGFGTRCLLIVLMLLLCTMRNLMIALLMRHLIGVLTAQLTAVHTMRWICGLCVRWLNYATSRVQLANVAIGRGGSRRILRANDLRFTVTR